jgi:poly-gamma-glutamate capsule biosynthesis protein CapA/YwtB (metallophosphatase superfamily)
MNKKLTRRTLIGTGLVGAAGIGVGTAWSLLHKTTSPIVRAKPTSTPTFTPTPVPKPVTVGITGDIQFDRDNTARLLASGSGSLYPFADTVQVLRQFDITVGNLECVVTTMLDNPVDKGINFGANPLAFSRLQAAKFDLVSLSNNHAGDYGPDAFADMLGHLPQYNIRVVGGGKNFDEANAPAIFERPGTRIGFVAACNIDPQSFQATATRPGDVWLDEDALHRLISAARPLCDFLIVFPHWGTEYVPNYNSQQQVLAHLAIDLGADLVVGSHPHIIQPNETYKNKLIVYSLGNFVFDRMPNELSLGNILSLSILGSELVEWKLIHTQINFNTGAPVLI